MHCKCTELVVKSRGSEERTIRNRLMVVKGQKVFAVCPGCKDEVHIPQLRWDAAPSSDIGPPLYLES